MSTGAPTVTSRRRRRGVSVAFSETAPPARAGSESSAGPVRPRIANRSSIVAMVAPSLPVTVTSTGTTRPMSVSVAAEAVAVMVNWAETAGSRPASRTAWSRCTRLSSPSTTGTPVSVVAAPIAANTAGQHRPTSASGTVVRLGASGSPNVAVTPVWSATRSGSQSTVSVAAPSWTSGSDSGPSAPAAIASTERIAAVASSVDTTGMPPSTVLAGNRNTMSIQVPEIGTLSTTLVPSGLTWSRDPVEVCVAVRFSWTCQSPGSAIRCTGLVVVRPAHSTSGASSTTASGPRTSGRPNRREVTSSGLTPVASTSSMAACSNRSSNSPTGSSSRVIPATAAGPGMMHTWSAS